MNVLTIIDKFCEANPVYTVYIDEFSLFDFVSILIKRGQQFFCEDIPFDKYKIMIASQNECLPEIDEILERGKTTIEKMTKRMEV